MRHFFDAGGRLIDCSPMYGSSQGVIGEGLQALAAQRRVFSAEKVWTSGDGAAQIEATRSLWRVPRFDLLQVHNLLAWQEQLPLLQAMKAAPPALCGYHHFRGPAPRRDRASCAGSR
jgi:diketogulonate reductase-like aldo/keto reductase